MFLLTCHVHYLHVPFLCYLSVGRHHSMSLARVLQGKLIYFSNTFHFIWFFQVSCTYSRQIYQHYIIMY